MLARTTFSFNSWVQVDIRIREKNLMIQIDDQAIEIDDDLLPRGFCFLGIKGGRARLRNLSLLPGTPSEKSFRPPPPASEILLHSTSREAQPLLSIITTVYDRVQCLDDCLTSLEHLTFRNFEHLIVADAPEPSVLEELTAVITRHPSTNNRLFATLTKRHNDWGIAPACAGLNLSSGKYVAFLSDDNGYLPDHFEPLLSALESDPELGFVYSSCLYAGRRVLRLASPSPGAIDLGQPVLRREVLDRHLKGTLPFHEFGWDWRMIERLLQARVRYRHIDRASFIFRLHQYPHLMQVPA